MARLYPFRALRYDPARVNLEAVVTQPYDKITPAMQQRYYEASPYNLVRVILGKHEPGDTEPQEFLPPGEKAHNVYTRAAEYLNNWRHEHILAEESEPAVYGYSQTYTVPGTDETRERRGFIALGHLYDYAEKVVYRHEQTFPKHKSDRLALFKATRAYCEQIYMLYSDPAFTAEKLIFEGAFPNGFDDNPADLAITDEYNVVHKVWKLTDPHLINLLLTAMADKKLIIADGHHRYETSVAYARERSAQLKLPLNQPRDEDEKLSPGHLPTPAFPEAAMMMTFVNMDAPGITILPTHRVVQGIENFSSPDFITKASAFYSITELADSASSSELIAHLNQAPGDSFLAATGDGNYLLTPKPEAIAPLLAGLPPKQRQLGVAQLHTVVLDHLLGLTEDKIRATGNIQYLREAAEAVALVESGEANIAFLIKPITLDQLKDVSLSGEVMPQKSTDFITKASAFYSITELADSASPSELIAHLNQAP
ncbi:MAG TPA: DUF1015 domain-containing protein, partial [Acidobacteriaceae bacterium]|nr:DUF1015 domain-containing protein [Acidobacteriaceae bacterium]